MPETAERLKLDLSQLSAKDRAELAYFLIHSLDEETDNGVEDAWESELVPRMDEAAIAHSQRKPDYWRSQRIE